VTTVVSSAGLEPPLGAAGSKAVWRQVTTWIAVSTVRLPNTLREHRARVHALAAVDLHGGDVRSDSGLELGRDAGHEVETVGAGARGDDAVALADRGDGRAYFSPT